MTSLESKIFKWIPQDKALHIIAGALIFGVFHLINPIVGIIAVLVLGILKEVFDHFTGGDVSFWDTFATTMGGLIGMLCFQPTHWEWIHAHL